MKYRRARSDWSAECVADDTVRARAGLPVDAARQGGRRGRAASGHSVPAWSRRARRGGSELPWAARWGLPKLRAEGRTLTDEPFPFLVAAPQCPPDRTWLDPDVLAGLDCLLHDATATGAADPARLCVAGFSMGGIGAFGMALRGSGRFAALISVCGACPSPERLEELADLPQWVAWAEDDEIAYLTDGSRRIADSLARHGRLVARPYRLGPAGGVGAHARTADAAFAEPELYRWLLATIAPDKPARKVV